MSMVPCGYCKNTGVDPFFGTRTSPSACAVCKGKKENFVPEPNTTCPACKGTGKDPRYRLPDSFCQGKAHVPQYKADDYIKKQQG